MTYTDVNPCSCNRPRPEDAHVGADSSARDGGCGVQVYDKEAASVCTSGLCDALDCEPRSTCQCLYSAQGEETFTHTSLLTWVVMEEEEMSALSIVLSRVRVKI